jgi:phage shock protein A
VEDLVNAKYGGDYLQTKNAKNELSRVTTDIRSLQRKIAQLEKRKTELLAMLNP